MRLRVVDLDTREEARLVFRPFQKGALQMISPHSLIVLALLAAASTALTSFGQAPERLAITHGVASGDVTSTSAVLWARASGESRIEMEVATDPDFRRDRIAGSTNVTEGTDF